MSKQRLWGIISTNAMQLIIEKPGFKTNSILLQSLDWKVTEWNGEQLWPWHRLVACYSEQRFIYQSRIHKVVRLGPIWVLSKLCLPPNTVLSYLQGVNHPLAPSGSACCPGRNKNKYCGRRKSRQTPSLAKSHSCPFWDPGDQLAPNGQTLSAKFLQTSQLINRRTHSYK